MFAVSISFIFNRFSSKKARTSDVFNPETARAPLYRCLLFYLPSTDLHEIALRIFNISFLRFLFF